MVQLQRPEIVVHAVADEHTPTQHRRHARLHFGKRRRTHEVVLANAGVALRLRA
jgi:hypothetical protein